MAAALVAVMLAAAPALAQERRTSLDEARQALQPGDRIRVVDSEGAVVDGRFHEMSPSSLRVVRKGTALELPRTRIHRIQKVHHEPDGVLFGLGAGAAAGLGFVVVQCRGSSEREDCHRAGSLVMIGPSAAAGALIDRAVRKLDTIFDRRSASAGRVRIAPIVQAHQHGLVVALLID